MPECGREGQESHHGCKRLEALERDSCTVPVTIMLVQYILSQKHPLNRQKTTTKSSPISNADSLKVRCWLLDINLNCEMYILKCPNFDNCPLNKMFVSALVVNRGFDSLHEITYRAGSFTITYLPEHLHALCVMTGQSWQCLCVNSWLPTASLFVGGILDAATALRNQQLKQMM